MFRVRHSLSHAAGRRGPSWAQFAVNQAEFGVGPSKGVNAAVLKAQILLDRARMPNKRIEHACQF